MILYVLFERERPHAARQQPAEPASFSRAHTSLTRRQGCALIRQCRGAQQSSIVFMRPSKGGASMEIFFSRTFALKAAA